MARSLCRCGSQIMWKADEPESDEWLFVPSAEVPDSLSHEALAGLARPAAMCKNCGRLYVQRDRSDDQLTEYVPASAMKIEYDGSVDAAYIQLTEIRAGEVAQTVPVDPREISGQIHLDFGRDGKLLGIEVLDASRFLPGNLLAEPDDG